MPDTWVYEVKRDDRFLMSSLVHDSERHRHFLAPPFQTLRFTDHTSVV